MKIKGGILCMGIAMLVFFGIASTTYAAGTITGTVTAASNGDPIDTIIIYAENADTGDLSYDYTDAAGLYSITVDAGDYIVYNLYYPYGDTNTIYIKEVSDTFAVAEGETVTKNLSLTRRGRLTGYVYESDGTTPIYQAYIYAISTANSGIAGYDYTSSSGLYLLTPQPGYALNYDYTLASEGQYTAYATATNYFPTYTTVNITDEIDTSWNVELSPASVVSGTATDENGDPLASATVVLYGYMSNYYYSGSTTTADDGTYTFHVYNNSYYNGNSIGTYTIILSKTGYISQTDSISITEAEQNVADNDYTLQTGGTITGHIYESDGSTPVSGATVSGDDSYGNTYSTTSADDGSYSLQSLRASDDYILTVAKTNYVTKKKYNISVTQGETTEDQDFELTNAIIFSGIVTMKNGDPVEGAVVYLYKRGRPRSSSADFSTTTLSNGTFSFTTIVPDLYRIKISKTGYVAYKKERLNLKSDKTDQTYELTAASSIYGRVTNKGTGVESATVYVYGTKKDADYAYASATTDNDGYYRINNLKSGKYKIRVMTTNFAEKIVTKKIKAGKEKEINIKVSKAGSISGYLYNKDTGLPIGGYTVLIKDSTISATTDSNGYYIIDGLSPGNYRVYTTSVLYGLNYYNKKVKVRANKETENINFNLTILE